MIDIACVGECMIELIDAPDHAPGGGLRRGFGGDTFNTAYYAARTLGVGGRVAFVTAVGDDPYSEELRSFVAGHGVDTRLICPVPGHLPGLYAIRTDADGERSFFYWRSDSAARRLFSAFDQAALLHALSGTPYVYVSGITLAVLLPDGMGQLLAVLRALRTGGTRIVFDSNIRHRLWPSRDRLHAALTEAYGVTDIALPNFADEAGLFGDANPRAAVDRLVAAGVREVVVKHGKAEVLALAGGELLAVNAPRVMTPVDTTAAGDAFNGAYLAARRQGADLPTAVRRAQDIAAQVVMHRGAIVPVTV